MSDKIREAFDVWVASIDKRRDANGWEPLTARDVNMLREGYMEAALAQQPAPAAPVAQEPVAWQFREIGEGEWQDCDEAWHDYCCRSPQHDTRRLYTAPPAAEQPGTWTPSGADYDRNIHSNPDAKAWADFFVETFPGLADKHDLMLGWFANAMMAMHDFLKSEQPDTAYDARLEDQA